MLILYSYPELCGVADNNGYGLKVFAFLKLTGVPFIHEQIFDASAAPRGQLPYIVDDGETIGDSETIIAHLIRKYRLTIDAALTAGAARMTDHLVTRMLDDLYWVMSYSRWKDEAYLPGVSRRLHARSIRSIDAKPGWTRRRSTTRSVIISRASAATLPMPAYARGLADLKVLADLIPANGYVHGAKPTSVDAGIYGFIANIHFFPIRDAAEGLRHRASESGAPCGTFTRPSAGDGRWPGPSILADHDYRERPKPHLDRPPHTTCRGPGCAAGAGLCPREQAQHYADG